MPGSYVGGIDGGAPNTSSSPSLIPSLRSFRLPTRNKTYVKSPASSEQSSGTSSPIVQKVTPATRTISPDSQRNRNDFVPETPESQRGHCGSGSQSPNGPTGSSSTQDDSGSPAFARRILNFKHSSPASGANSCLPSPGGSTTTTEQEELRGQTMNEYEVFCEREHCLRELLRHFPSADIMEAQDLLVSSQWDLDKAIELAKTKPLKSTRRKSSPTNQHSAHGKGIVYSDSASGSESRHAAGSSTARSRPEEIVLDSDDDDEDSDYFVKSSSSRNRNHSVSNGLNSVKQDSLNDSGITANRKRKVRQAVISDSDEDDESSPPLQSAEQDAYASDGSQGRSSSFSVLDYQPSNTVPLSSVASSTSGASRSHELNTYSRKQPKQYIPSNINVDGDDDVPVHSSSSSKGSSRKSGGKLKNRVHDERSRKRRRREESDIDDLDEEEYGNNDVYDSEESDIEENLTPARSSVLTFFQEAVLDELSTIPGCSKKKAEAIVKYRPFTGWVDLVQKLNNDKSLSADLLNGAKKVLDMRTAVSRLMNKCQRIALEMEDLVEALKQNKEDCRDYVSQQPSLLNQNMHLTSYQMLGLNWLLLMHNQEVNGILADEMGLGKTVQAIAFLAYLKQQSIDGPHLIVVPSSTLDNWQNELRTWWPSVSVLCYHGSQEFRRELRVRIVEDEVEEFDIMVTTYNMVTSSAEDRNFFKKLEFNYVIFDEAHMLKNMASQRYQHLMRVRASRRLLLTGTPLQNNLVELMSLLIFAVPHMFSGKTEQVKQMFSAVCKSDEGKTKFERERIEHAKRIMKPFVLRRLKTEVLKDLPNKHEETKFCKMAERQGEHYRNLVAELSEEVRKNKEKDITTSGAGMMMQLRKAANHPLLLRNRYTDDKLVQMSKLMLKEPTHSEANPDLIFEDMSVMSDFELHRLCKQYKSLKSFVLSKDDILESGKFAFMDKILPEMIEEGNRILLFSQFTMILDIIEEYMKIRELRYLRLDGQIPVSERQQLIDEYNQNQDIPVFLLSTRAGGLGINLTAANVVLIHDIDFNPYNDKQAEDRCHRVGQLRDVTVIRMISEDTIEEGMLQRAKEKLKLERDITTANDDEERDSASVAKLLRDALGLSQSNRS